MKDFGEILDDWEKQSAIPKVNKNKIKKKASRKYSVHEIMEAWMATHSVENKDANMVSELSRGAERRRLLNKRSDATIDLHGVTQEEAWQMLDDFFKKCVDRSYEKLTIIHGKGNHTNSEGVLKKVVKSFIEKCPFAGESGRHKAESGGTGATWVILKSPASK